MSEKFSFEVRPDESGTRVDSLIARRRPDLSRSLARRLIDEGHVQVNEHLVKASYHVASSDRVSARLQLPASLTATPEDRPLNVVFQDQDFAVIDKAAGMVVHPSAGHPGGTLANALMYLFPGVAGVGTPQRPGIVHRLDKDTSGLMLVALTPHAHRSLQRQIAAHEATRRYVALVSGRMDPAAGIIDAPIGRDPQERRRMATYGVAARPARTTFRTVEEFPAFSLLEATLHTGRTHQIRVHLAAVGHPIAGDSLYRGTTVAGLARQFLHAYRLDLRSPSTNEQLHFSSEPPVDLQLVLRNLRN
jgi:23S rRNA pseudouridine1911/1915/1917 synthase